MTNEAISAEQQRKQLAWETSIRRLDSEINLFWSRGLYFWAFVAVAFAAYSQVAPDKLFERQLISSFGFLLSTCWLLANLGGKYWQGVWERRVVEFELEITGKLYGRNRADDDEMQQAKSCNSKGRRFSVSRLAISVSAICLTFWLLLLLSTIDCPIIVCVKNSTLLVPALTGIFLLLIVWFTLSKDKL
jgi:hypothetical protein